MATVAARREKGGGARVAKGAATHLGGEGGPAQRAGDLAADGLAVREELGAPADGLAAARPLLARPGREPRVRREEAAQRAVAHRLEEDLARLRHARRVSALDHAQVQRGRLRVCGGRAGGGGAAGATEPSVDADASAPETARE